MLDLQLWQLMLELEVSVPDQMLGMGERREVSRAESFRTVLTTQKKRLLRRTQDQNQYERTKVEKDIKKKEEEDEHTGMAFLFGALQKLSLKSRKDSEKGGDKGKMTPPTPPTTPDQNDSTPSSPLLKRYSPDLPEDSHGKTPVSADCPLLKKSPQDPVRRRLRSFNKSLKKAQSFRMSRDKMCLQKSISQPILEPLERREVTFIVRKSILGRVGWKIMPEDENLDLKMNKDILRQVLERIRSMQYSGEVVPDKISIMLQ